jgi:hypothetical protein
VKCVVCGVTVDPRVTLPENLTHPTCLPYDEPEGQDPFNVMLKTRLTEVIKWADRQNPRSSQFELGPSEIGDPCDRRMAYRLAGVEACNFSDPWAAIVGTAMHAWLDEAFQKWLTAHNSDEYSTETSLSINRFVQGHSDVYDRRTKTVIDWKGAGPTVMKKVKANGPSAGYQIQTHIYGYGYEQKGWPVERVALVFLPRAGRLADMYPWSAPYDRSVAIEALKRPHAVARKMVELDILKDGNAHRFQQIDATPSDSCGFCPQYNSMKPLEEGADEKGCPGK